MALAGVMLVLPAVVVWAEEGQIPSARELSRFRRAPAARPISPPGADLGALTPWRAAVDQVAGDPTPEGPRRSTIYLLIVGVAFIALIVFAGINTISNDSGGVLGASDEAGAPLEQFAVVPDARRDAEGDANIARDDCDSARIPCPEDNRRTPACEVNVAGAIRVCDLFNRPLVLSFWFTWAATARTSRTSSSGPIATTRAESTSSPSTSVTSARR